MLGMEENPYQAPKHVESRLALRKWARILLLVAIAATVIGVIAANRH
ncbi:MAG TPA: hypothetical protein VG125_10270 [Pirellulales bacterium]|jgi:hypothetical protein|nr:hypothetical protein [Pirellulales bacterium]